MKEAGQQFVEVTAGGVRWQVPPECRDLLLGPMGLRLQEWLRAGLAQIVKHGPHRTVYSVALPGLRFYLKHYRLPDLRSWLRQLVRPAKARIEFERALAVARRHVPTIVPVGLGESCAGLGPADSFLLTRGLDDADSMTTFIEKILPGFDPMRATRIRQRLARSLGEFMASLHAAGIVHQDLHAANILVRLEDADRPALYLVDLHAVCLRRSLNWRASRDNLVILNRWFILRAGRSDRLRFWKAYCQARSSLQVASPALGRNIGLDQAHKQARGDLARDLEARTWQSNLRFWEHRDQRCSVTNRYYYRIRSLHFIGYAVRDLEPAVLDALLADPDAPFQRPGIKLLKDSRSSTVGEVELPVAGQSQRLIYKRFKVTTWTDPWTALVRTSPVLRSWIFGHGLRERCLPTARPIAVFHRRCGPFAYEGYLLTEKIPAAQDLQHYVAGLEQLDRARRRSRLRACIAQVAQLIAALHRRQLSHRDLKAGNILITATSAWLIDLVGVAPQRRLSPKRRVQNLARLHVSFHDHPGLTRTDRLRFLRVYLQWGLFGRMGWKRWWRAIEGATQDKIVRNRRNGRPIS